MTVLVFPDSIAAADKKACERSMLIDTPDWVSDAIFYQIFPDRFSRGSVSSGSVANQGLHFEDWDVAPTTHGFKGGDLYGIIDRLDYLSELGVTALYLNPIFTSASNHRYHTYDYFTVDPLLGGNAAFQSLVAECHRRGIRIILDGVFNHSSRGFWQFHHVMENGAASPYAGWFFLDPERLNGHRQFIPYPDPETARALSNGVGSLEAVGYHAWWNLPALPKFNTGNPEVREFLLSVAEHWMRFGIDGWRLDVPNEIDDDNFWREFRRRVRAINPEAYIVGEIWGSGDRWLQGDMWDAVMNYQVTAACLGFFGGHRLDLEETRRPSSFGHVRPTTAREFADELTRLEKAHPDRVNQSQLNLLDSHDMPRFLTCVGHDTSSLKMAWLLLCTRPGAPCIYYGDEIGLSGKHDPDCRKGFPWEKDRWNVQLLDWYRDCIELRKKHPSLRHGTRNTLLAENNIFVSIHQAKDDCVIAGWNTGETPCSVSLQAGSLPSGVTKWHQWRSATLVEQASAQSDLTLTIPARSATVLSASGSTGPLSSS